MAEYTVSFEVHLTVEAESAEEAEKIGKRTLDVVDWWPTVYPHPTLKTTPFDAEKNNCT